MADQIPTPQHVRLSCPAEVPQLCDALTDALSGLLSDGATLRQVRPEEVSPSEPGSLGIELRLDRMSTTALNGRLILHTPAPADPREGPELGVNAVDTTLSDEMISRFAERLLSTHDALQAALSPRGAPQID